MFGAGRTALAARDFGAAAKFLEQTLARQPRATAAHYPLAMAYRGLGDLARAEAHLKHQGKDDPRPTDPLMGEIDTLVQTPEAYNVRGGQALDGGQWAQAAEYFRRGSKSIRPTSRCATASARRWRRWEMPLAPGAVRRSDSPRPDARAGPFQPGRAVEQRRQLRSGDRALLKRAPARARLRAGARAAGRDTRPRRPSGRGRRGVSRALEADPSQSEALYGRGMAFVRLRRYRDARDAFAEGTTRFPDQPLFKLALARLLAAAPDNQVRDGRRAMAVVNELMKGPQSLELAETAAMGLAEVGRFDQAVEAQQSVLAAARSNNLQPVVRRATENLALYEKREPSRRPFADDELP